MPLDDRDEALEPAEEFSLMAERVVIKAVGDEGATQAVASGDPDTTGQDDPESVELLGDEALDRATTWGSYGIPPVDTEGIMVPCEAGPCIVAERYTKPTLPSAFAAGDGACHGTNGEYVACVGGDVEAEPGSGKKIKLGATATKALVLDDDEVMSNAYLNGYFLAIEQAIAAVAGGGSPSIPTWPQPGGHTIGNCVATATKVDGE
jgi:hypothetical protein